MSAALAQKLIEEGFSRRVAAALAYGDVLVSCSDIYTRPWKPTPEDEGLERVLLQLACFGKKSIAEVQQRRAAKCFDAPSSGTSDSKEG